MQFSSIVSFAALLSVCTAAVAAPDIKTKTVTKTATKTATTTVTPTPSPSCEAAIGYAPGNFIVRTKKGATNEFINYCNGARADFQDDGNFVIYPGNDNSGPGWTPFTNGVFNCRRTKDCRAEFTSDGNFQIVNYGETRFSTNTAGMNAQRLILASGQPYVTIVDTNGTVLYSSGSGAAARKFSALSLSQKD